jgi:hypothetical protein
MRDGEKWELEDEGVLGVLGESGKGARRRGSKRMRSFQRAVEEIRCGACAPGVGVVSKGVLADRVDWRKRWRERNKSDLESCVRWEYHVERKGGGEVMRVSSHRSVEDQGEGVVVVGLRVRRSGGER